MSYINRGGTAPNNLPCFRTNQECPISYSFAEPLQLATEKEIKAMPNEHLWGPLQSQKDAWFEAELKTIFHKDDIDRHPAFDSRQEEDSERFSIEHARWEQEQIDLECK